MSVSKEDLKSVQEELLWIRTKGNAEARKVRPWNMYDVLVPAGCLVTLGVLGNGIYQMYKRDSQKQQKMMRLRVLAQGVTILLATASLFQYKFKEH